MSSVSAEHATTPEALVVGAGPTGLLLAGDLAAAGVHVALVERRAQESNLTRAFAVHARTLEVLDARGRAEELLDTGTFQDTVRFFGRARIDLSRLPTRFPGVLLTPQYEIERILEKRAVEAGALILRGTEVVGLSQDAGGVDVDVRTEAGERRLRAAYAVGADGVHSRVREALGMPFPGKSVLRSVMLADVLLDTPPAALPAFDAGPAGFAFVVPFGDGWYRVIAWRRGCELPSDAPVDMADLRDLVRTVLGTDHGMRDPRWTSRFHSDERQVPHYRDGRVFLAGDAAHVHSPAGGMGMNAGIQDAANLGWKLAAVLRGRADDALLDSYHDERHPVGKLVLRLSGAIVRAALLGSPVARGLREAATVAAGALPALTHRGGLLVSGIGIDYPAPPGAHPWTGRRVPDLPLRETAGGPSRLYEALRAGSYVRVLPRAASAREDAREEAGVVTVTRADARRATLLVRPDGHVAEASGTTA
ncbi:FAD-dependent monooxygenase [Streptomyces albireticuli]|uniref:FAD-dependent oxidoreductase n=1 Tax=Streptomyces albireticuli TaxID=1940 RepID=A0A2A2DAS5_9ACTN|nr:FAD-dependent monooxygenase [Streptomyces albireticuli]MCD9142913.1 FAD-dependent monooxygenase [Streptomyces albireticuli]MCD9162768.1 FAD-dependent monooxygenase [Streptomyces albireticuli]MCD9192328.1 FAD-dependent monooxygenase [Streptomyces albireticuli]PAU48536.1 FAD-dependent oxidoreductase [Streptomyces albireticuli]